MESIKFDIRWSHDVKVGSLCLFQQRRSDQDMSSSFPRIVGHWSMVDNAISFKYRGCGSNTRHREIHSFLNDHLKWQPSFIWSFLQWQAKEHQGHLLIVIPELFVFSVRGLSVTRVFTILVHLGWVR